jgi:hypothetical protein
MAILKPAGIWVYYTVFKMAEIIVPGAGNFARQSSDELQVLSAATGAFLVIVISAVLVATCHPKSEPEEKATDEPFAPTVDGVPVQSDTDGGGSIFDAGRSGKAPLEEPAVAQLAEESERILDDITRIRQSIDRIARSTQAMDKFMVLPHGSRLHSGDGLCPTLNKRPASELVILEIPEATTRWMCENTVDMFCKKCFRIAASPEPAGAEDVRSPPIARQRPITEQRLGAAGRRKRLRPERNDHE